MTTHAEKTDLWPRVPEAADHPREWESHYRINMNALSATANTLKELHLELVGTEDHRICQKCIRNRLGSE